MHAFRNNLAKFRAKDFHAESVYSTTQRVAQLIKTLKDSDAKNVLLVGHGANLTASIRSLLGFEPGLLRQAGGLETHRSLFLKQKIANISLSNVGMTHLTWIKKTKSAKSSSNKIKQAILFKIAFLVFKKPLKKHFKGNTLLIYRARFLL